ncbi:hypothetical protein ALC53_12884 [Atta colombica]|uniref:DNA-directed DNA polymerase n=1 Tax=Atta colombica TaxID=520822 RepID=A0A151HYU4_9HYME|nr:hypothetical protein ALC53_12884 [Atta colombica]
MEQTEHELAEQATQLNTREEYVAWEQRCDGTMQDSDGEIDTVFESRILTGMDNTCFASVVAALHPAKNNTNRESSYQHYIILNLQGIQMTLNQIIKFENQNNISVNVYSIEEQKKILPLRFISRKRDKHVNLLYVQDSQDDNEGYFVLIKDVFPLVYDDSLSKYCFRHGNDCIAWFVEELRNLAHKVNTILSTNVLRFRRPAHSNCNLNYKDSHRILIVFYNLSTKNEQKKTCVKLHFTDSCKFLASSLEKLALYLGKDKLKITRSEFLRAEDFDLLTRKGIFPYEYLLLTDVFKNCDSRVMLKHISVKFELLTDIDMVMFVKRRIREDLSKCSAQANNKYMQSSNRKIHRNRCILCIFYVNLYDWAMCQPCHTPIFDDIALDSSTGYILEVDLEYPQHLHDVHADLLFCPTREKSPSKREDKLLATLHDKKRYMIHYRNLHQYTRHGLRITKIHRILQFAQSSWLRVYIELTNKKVPDLMKDENNGAVMTEFVGLRAKMYALRVQGKKDTKKVKDIKSNVVARSVMFENYIQCLNDAIKMSRRQSCISKIADVHDFKNKNRSKFAR